MIIRGEATFVLQEISTLASLEGLRIFPESEAICMENATAGSEASRSTEGALRISPASAGSKNAAAGGAANRSTEDALRIFPESEAICMENATAGSEASRSTEGALSPNPEDLSQRTCELRKASCKHRSTLARTFLPQAMPGPTERTTNRHQPVGA